VSVFQWSAQARKNDELPLKIENTINQGFIGAGEMNALDKTMSFIQGGYDLKELMVGYRKFEEDHTPMFPPGSECFRVS
jgi:hypothetical protein